MDDENHDQLITKNILQRDNPNYFNVEGRDVAPTESRGSGIFTFRKRLLDSDKQSPPSTVTMKKNIETKRNGSLKKLWRSRSNSYTLDSHQRGQNCTQTCENAETRSSQSTSVQSRLEMFDESLNCFGDQKFSDRTSDLKFYSLSHNTSVMIDGSSQSRRHSVGTFSGKNKFCTTSFIDEAPTEIAPKAPSYYRNQNQDQNLPTAAMCATTDDILIVTSKQSELGILWVSHLKSCFDKITKQRGRMSFNFLHVKIEDDKLDSDLIQRCQTTKLQVVIICPFLMGLEHSYVKKKLSHIIKPERTIGLLLDLNEVQLIDIHREFLPGYNKWRKCVLKDQDQSFVSSLLGIAQDILGRALRQRPMATEVSTTAYSTIRNGTIQKGVAGKNHDNFTVIPKKMRFGNNKATVLMTDSILKDDYIKIRIEKIGHIIEINNIKRRNPYTLQFNVPESCMEISMMIGVRVFKNNVDMGVRPIKCESQMKNLEQILKSVTESPMDFMCHAYGFSTADPEKLDLHMVRSFQANVPPNFNLLSCNPQSPKESREEIISGEYPTLLHFASRWGLERLGLLLLECPGGEVASEMKNSLGKTPAEIAETHGHFKLANSLKNFSKMNEFTTMYQYFKECSKTSDNTESSTRFEFPVIDDFKNDAHPAHYLEMKTKNEVNANKKDESLDEVTYLNIGCVPNVSKSFDVVDAIEMNMSKKLESSDLLNNLNSMQIKEEEEKEISNELKITEENYYDSNALNNVSGDDFSKQCSDVLDYVESSLLQPTKTACRNEIQYSDYLLQPSNRPVTLGFSDYLTHPSNRPLNDTNSEETRDFCNSPVSRVNLSPMRETSHLRLYFKKKSESLGEDGSGYSKIHELASPSPSKSSKSGALKRTDSDASKRSVDDELVEIINDFKNNVFTIQEVEELVSSWKNRNDVQQSFREKQEQMQKMREEYERIQEIINEKLRRPSPFERMKQIFSKKHKKSPITLPLNLTGDPNFSVNDSNRPNSTLSLASSNSSGRMSSSSLGDSGTHSDNEERRNQTSYKAGSLVLENYLIPPAPRPIYNRISPIEEKENIQSILSNSSNSKTDVDHYILFPSNLPLNMSPQCSMSTFKKQS